MEILENYDLSTKKLKSSLTRSGKSEIDKLKPWKNIGNLFDCQSLLFLP